MVRSVVSAARLVYQYHDELQFFGEEATVYSCYEVSDNRN